MDRVKCLTNPRYIRKFQEFCGVLAKPEHPPGHSHHHQPCEDKQINESVKHRNGYHIASNTITDDSNNNNNNSLSNKASIKNGLHKNGVLQLKNVKQEEKPYIIKYKTIYYLAKFGAALGDELFYLVFFPFWIWNVNSVIGRQTAIVWCLVMYLGQATKDYLRCPRPPSPPVFRLETTHLQEYAMPSTHAMSGLGIPCILFYILTTRYEFSVWLALPIGLTWTLLVCLCRLYLGVHTLLDIIAGCVYAFGIICCALPYIQEFDMFIQTHPYAPIVLLVTSLALCTVCYPSKDRNSAKGDAVQIISVTTGVCIGLWFNRYFHLSAQPEVTPSLSIASLSAKWLALSLLRLLSGGFMAALVREVAQSVSIKGFSYLYGLKTPDKTHPEVQTSYKFVSYMSIGICVITVIPAVHKIMGILRPNFYFETL